MKDCISTESISLIVYLSVLFHAIVVIVLVFYIYKKTFGGD